MQIKLKDFLKVPNLLSMFRIILLPIFLYTFLTDKSIYLTMCILILSGLTDILDGFIARHFNQVSELGKILDPLADKVTQICILFALWFKELVPGFIVGILFGKEFLMLLGAIYLKGVLKTNIIPSNKWGKIATITFYVSAGFVLFRIPYAIIGVYITLILMIIAFISYGKILISMHKDAKEKKGSIA